MQNSENSQPRDVIYRLALQGIIIGLLLVLLAVGMVFPYLPQLLALLPPLLRLAVMVLFVFLPPAIFGLAGRWMGARLEHVEREKAALRGQIAQFEAQQQEKSQQDASRSQLEIILERGKREWEGIFDAVQSAIIVADDKGLVMRCNRAAIQWLNNNFDQVIGHAIDSLDLGELDGRPIRLAASAGETYIPAKGGWYNVSQYPLLLDEDKQGAIFIVQDINRRKNDEAIIRQQKNYLETLVSLSPVAIVSVDLNKHIQSSNPYFTTLFGYTHAEVLGRPLDQVLGSRPEDSLMPDIPTGQSRSSWPT